MIAYNKTWLANQLLHNEVKKDAGQGNITPAELKAIEEKYPVGFYTPNIFARVGLFILTCIIVAFADGLISLMFASSGIVTDFGWFIFLGITTYIALEVMIRNSHHYQSGVDDALLIIAGGQFAVGFGLMFYHDSDSYFNYYLMLAGIVLVLGSYLTLRFGDMLMSIISSLAFFALVFFIWLRIIPAGLSTAPFMMMVVTGGCYWLAQAGSKQNAFINYANCFIVVRVISLLGLYAAGNYLVIQTLSGTMTDKIVPLPFGGFFWAWTIVVPFVYIGAGLRKKDYVLLRTGLLLITAAALTFRNYYHVLPVDVTLTILGLIVLAIVYGVTRYLKTPKHGFTTAEPDEANLMDHLKVESLVAAGTFSHAPAAPAPETGVKFGGGSFGGGGSSSDF